MSRSIFRTRTGRVAAIVGAAAVLAVPAAATLPATAGAHDTDHCYHGNIYNGGWSTIYVAHFTDSTGAHYNLYDHYLNGVFQHSEANRCN